MISKFVDFRFKDIVDFGALRVQDDLSLLDDSPRLQSHACCSACPVCAVSSVCLYSLCQCVVAVYLKGIEI